MLDAGVLLRKSFLLFHHRDKRKVFPVSSKSHPSVQNMDETLSHTSTSRINGVFNITPPSESIVNLQVLPFKEGIQDQYDIVASRHLLVFIQAALAVLDKTLPSDPQDQEAYEHSKKIIQEIHIHNNQLLILPKPKNILGYWQYNQHINDYWQTLMLHMQKFNPQHPEEKKQMLPPVKGKKSQNLARFYGEYLTILTHTYLSDTEQRTIPLAFHEKRKQTNIMLTTLNEILQNNSFSCEKQHDLFDVIEMLKRREERQRNRPNKKFTEDMIQLATLLKSDNESEKQEAITIALQNLETQSIVFIRAIIESPQRYLPVFNSIDMNDLLQDLLFSHNPFDYILLNYAGKLSDLKEKLASLCQEVSQYLARNSDDLIEKDHLWHKIGEQFDSLLREPLYFSSEQKQRPYVFPEEEDLSDITSTLSGDFSSTHPSGQKKEPYLFPEEEDLSDITSTSSENVSSTHYEKKYSFSIKKIKSCLLLSLKNTKITAELLPTEKHGVSSHL